MLKNLLVCLLSQKTEGLFTYSAVIVDNDHLESARPAVAAIQEKESMAIEYYCEPEQNIALARNKAVKNAKGRYVAFIDDDELPTNTWLSTLHNALLSYNADGVLGPVNPDYETAPPKWVIKGRFFERPSHKTGHILQWTETRSGNVLLKRGIFDSSDNMFKVEFGSGGEDRDFFRRMIAKKYVFRWCNEAPVYEKVPQERCKRTFMLKRALLRGKVSLNNLSSNNIEVVKSLVAVALYSVALPFLFLASHHMFMKYLIKEFQHIGRLLSLCGINVIKEKYITN